MKRFISLLIAVHIFFGACITNCVYADDLQIKGKSYILMEPTTGKVIIENNADEKTRPASITKVMTIILIYEALEQNKINMDDIVTVSEHAASMGGTQIFLEENEQQTVETMLKSIIVASANDASVAMAEHIGGSEENFVKMMNEKAQELGMKNTHFVNACGLDVDDHYTTARDVAIMSRELTNKHPQVHKYSKIWQDTIIHKTRRGEKEFVLTNTNKLLKWYKYATGLKTGSTSKAKYCLAGTAEKDGLKLIGVVMGAPDYKTRFREVMKLFNYGYANYSILKGKAKDEKVGEIKVLKGKEDKIDVYIKKEVSFMVKKGSGTNLEIELNIDKNITAPVKPGDLAGEIIYKIKGEEVGKSKLIVKKEVKKANLVESIGKFFDKIF